MRYVPRELQFGEMQQQNYCEWTREGSLKSEIQKVDADGDLDRYLEKCMLVHDERIGF